ncbi:acetylxylan esterase [Thiothrix lacustris]|jgi:cephalosporin-C deacetylase|uniref:Acetylxylan esterase n=1 Tax=Thiothrix lacustris TaxID=525917 RepID=A0ABY9MPT7_9GAMM|nr:acetylxylan esterase [Thiothrix lacustris]WML90246.1 acetylxylan esterase [Thiothrix lacustris]
MTAFTHSFAFDPSYGYSLEDLLAVGSPEAPADFEAFWQARYARAMQVHPCPRIRHTGMSHAGFEVYSLRYFSTDHFVIRGWVLIPQDQPVTRGVVFGHGYGGCDGPDYRVHPEGTVLLFPCFRGLARSQHPPVSSNPSFHVLHDIDKLQQYIIGGCVDDLWLAVSSMQMLFPATKGHIGYSGISFGGGIGALAMPWDARIQRAHLNVPTFGHQPLRLQLPTIGSGAAVQRYQQQHGTVLNTLQYYDAASAAQSIQQPMHVAAALFDPAVAPPGQFAVYNALTGEKTLFVLEAGHFDYPNRAKQEQALQQELEVFFALL